ncbi:MAG: ThiF family adenylyltransferase [Planctomycetes bacterium]|nr:ThiF family adenylyltransferase [Planctomycetota bacterium]
MDRYSRQHRIAGIGQHGQERLRSATVLVVGCGALGTHSADALARAGVGNLWLCDRDVVEWSNLQRQVLFTEADARAGIPKATAAATRLREANSDVRIVAHVAECSATFLAALPGRPDLVLDGTDNFPTRYLLNDWCHANRVPWIYAGATGTEGAAMVVRPGGPCLRCLWPDAPATADVGTCETVGILAPAIAAVAAFQVAEALKLLVGSPDVATGVFTCDVWRGHYTRLPLLDRPSPDCVACQHGQHPALVAPAPMAATLCGRDAVQIDPGTTAALDLTALAGQLAEVATDLQRTPHLLRFTADGVRFSVFPGGRALLFGVRDPLRARALYDRWIGRRP